MKKVVLISAIIVFAFCSCSGIGVVEQNVDTSDAMHKSAKRGVAFNFTQATDLPLMSPYISWDYNWGPDVSIPLVHNWFDQNDVEFCPMAWNANFDDERIRSYVKAHPSTKYLLAFNEPNLVDQARMTPTEAAQKWPEVRALATELGLKLVSPAMNYGTLSGYNDPIKWLDEFFTLVPLSDVDVIAVHCYMASPSAFYNYVDMFRKYNKPIWMTEFCAWDPVPGSVEVQMNYMCMVLNFMETDPQVERYAWFIPRAGGAVNSKPFMQLLTHYDPSELTPLGVMYTRFSSFDKSVWLNAEKPVNATQYVDLSDNTIQVRVSTNDTTQLMLSNIMINQWVEYQVGNKTNCNNLNLRYATLVNSTIAVTIDDVLYTFDMPKTGSGNKWETISLAFPVSAGIHTMRITILSGALNIESFNFN